MSNKKKINIFIKLFLTLVLLIGTVGSNLIALYWDSPLQTFLGVVGEGTKGGSGDEDLFVSSFDSSKDVLKSQKKLANDIVGEGAILLKNDNSLPLQTKSKISLFGIASKSGDISGSGSGEVKGDKLDLETSLKNSGFEVNPKLVEFYKNSKHAHGPGTGPGSGDATGDWKLDEVPQNEYSQDIKNSYEKYNDAAIIVISRQSGEGGDLPTEMSRFGGDANKNYLELSKEEEDLLKAVKDSNKFKTTILLVNAPNAMELGFMDKEEFGIDGCLWYAGTGANGIESIGKILNGEINPSGRTVDTYAYDNFSAPSMQNFGDFRYVDSKGKVVDNSYLNYGEGIYVGYRYYETRYEDSILETDNVGNYVYSDEVMFPFGYGLSYTNFSWSNFNVTQVENKYTVTVDIKNIGKVAGKEVVELYSQTPQKEKIESSAVNLVDFEKTKMLEPGEEEKVSFEVSKDDLKTYDYLDKKTYVLPEGNYFLTVAENAHQAVNNILSNKGVQDRKLDGKPVKENVYTWKETDERILDESVTNKKISNQFDDVAVSLENYLTRNNWSKLDNDGLRYATGTKEGISNVTDSKGTVGTIEAPKELIKDLKTEGYEVSGAPDLSTLDLPSVDSYTYDADKKLKLSDLIGVPYDDKKWDSLLNQMKLSEMHQLFNKSGYGTAAIESINKPKTFEYDGPAGISNMITGTGSFSYPSTIMLAATWNKELAKEKGDLLGEDALATKTSGWYAPAVNIHRTPFSGRNYEYYSEDPILSGKLSVEETKAVQSKGVYVYIKHFALNDQESNRAANGHVAIWANEQAIRDIYLKPFEINVEQGKAKGIMMGLNRIGRIPATTNYNLITNVARGEWGFDGIVITDYTSNQSPQYADQFLAAGGNLFLATAAIPLSDAKQDWTRAKLRESTHRVLYVIANSLAMNGLAGGAEYQKGFAVYKILLIVLDVLVLLIMIMVALNIRKVVKETNEEFTVRMDRTKARRRTIWIISGVILVAILIVFYVFVWPIIQDALLM